MTDRLFSVHLKEVLHESAQEEILKLAEDIVIQLGHSKGNSEMKIYYGLTNIIKAFHLMAWLPGLQTGRGELMSVTSDKEVRGDLILGRELTS